MATLTLTKGPRHRVTVWTLERRMFDATSSRRVTGPGRHTATISSK
jgi:hypothetical protein